MYNKSIIANNANHLQSDIDWSPVKVLNFLSRGKSIPKWEHVQIMSLHKDAFKTDPKVINQYQRLKQIRKQHPSIHLHTRLPTEYGYYQLYYNKIIEHKCVIYKILLQDTTILNKSLHLHIIRGFSE